MKIELTKALSRLLKSFRYPASLPEDILSDLGITLPKTSTLMAFLEKLSTAMPTKFYKMMFKGEAEALFVHALKKESFKSTTFFSYYFNEGWLVIALHYDAQEKLRRLYVQCPSCATKEGFDLSLPYFPEKESIYSIIR